MVDIAYEKWWFLSDSNYITLKFRNIVVVTHGRSTVF